MTVLIALTSVPLCSRAETDYKEVDPDELLANPKLYWSLGIVFKDTLTRTPGGRELRVGNKKYTPLMTKVLGMCYAEKDIVPKLKSFPVNHEYLFRGTVLNVQGGMFSSGNRFHVIIGNVAEALEDVNPLETGLYRTSTDPFLESEAEDVVGIEDILMTIHQDIFAYAEEKGIPLADLLRRNSAYEPTVVDMIHAGIRAFETEKGTTSVQILSQMIRDVLADQYAEEDFGVPPYEELVPVEPIPAPSKPDLSLKAGIGKLPPEAEPAPKPARPKPPATPPGHDDPIGW